MIRFLCRLLGLVLIAAGFVALVLDGTRSIAGDRLIYATVGDTWRAVHPGSLAALEKALDERGLGWVWDPALLHALLLPTAVVGLGAGALLLIAGRRRAPRIGVIGRR